MQSLHCNAVQRCIVQDHNSISVECKALEGQQGVVGLDNNIAGLVLIWEDTARQCGNSATLHSLKSMFYRAVIYGLKQA